MKTDEYGLEIISRTILFMWMSGRFGEFGIFTDEAISARGAFCLSELGEDWSKDAVTRSNAAEAACTALAPSIRDVLLFGDHIGVLLRLRPYHDREENRGVARLREPGESLSKRDR
jgi:hypothetical protein